MARRNLQAALDARVLALLLIWGCASQAPTAHDATAPAGAVTEIRLVLTFDDGVADSQVVPIEVDGASAWLALDTGSADSFLFRGPDDPPYVADAGEVRLGSEVLRLPGYGDDGIGVEMFQGKPILGILGLDFFLPRGEIDYPGRRVVAYGEARVSGANALPGMPLRIVDDLARVFVRIDGQELDLMVDTGAHDTLWLGIDGRPGDEEVEIQTADGEVVSAFAGEATIQLPSEPARSVPVLRASYVPYISPWLVDEQKANGLLGLTSIGFRRVIFDGDRLRLGPRLEP